MCIALGKCRQRRFDSRMLLDLAIDHFHCILRVNCPCSEARLACILRKRRRNNQVSRSRRFAIHPWKCIAGTHCPGIASFLVRSSRRTCLWDHTPDSCKFRLYSSIDSSHHKVAVDSRSSGDPQRRKCSSRPSKTARFRKASSLPTVRQHCRFAAYRPGNVSSGMHIRLGMHHRRTSFQSKCRTLPIGHRCTWPEHCRCI